MNNTNIDKCFICGSQMKVLKIDTDAYSRCKECGHEILSLSRNQTYIMNDIFDEKNVRLKFSMLDKFKSNAIKDKIAVNDKILLDIGSASGKFLFQNKSKFKKCYGLEVTEEAVLFSRNIMHLNIVTQIDDIPDFISLATAWHSLEHIPPDALIELLEGLSEKMKPGGRFLISVPNANSNTYLKFKKDWAFYDVPNHLHQFTSQSLNMLLNKFNFKRCALIKSYPYNIFCIIQSILNRIAGGHNYLYYRLKRDKIQGNRTCLIRNIVFLPIAVLAGLFLFLMNSVFYDEKNESALTVVFEKEGIE